MSAATGAPAEPLAPATPADAPASWREAVAYFVGQPSPRVLMLALAVAATARVAVGSVSLWDLAVVAGLLLFWPLNEWLIHVFILHAKPKRIGGFVLDTAVPRSHRAHHRDPWNLPLVFIPLHSFLYSIPLLVGLAFALAPTPQLALTAITTYLLLALHYEWVHFLCHTRVVPRGACYRGLIRNHRLHHFKNEHHWFGVSRLAADGWLRTAPDPEAVERSETARSLAG